MLEKQRLEQIATAREHWPRVEFVPAITKIARRYFGTIRTISVHVAKYASPSHIDTAKAIMGYIPALGRDHALSVAEPFGFNLTEPQASAGIAHFCRANDDAALKAARCTAAVRALIPNEPDDSPFIKPLNSVREIHVESEAYVAHSFERMDWVISWRDKHESLYRVVVEMKYNHSVTCGQLRDYREDALEQVKPAGDVRLVLLTLKGEFSRKDQPKPSVAWLPVAWLNFLRRWEAELRKQHESSATFAAFRRQLWARIGA